MRDACIFQYMSKGFVYKMNACVLQQVKHVASCCIQKADKLRFILMYQLHKPFRVLAFTHTPPPPPHPPPNLHFPQAEVHRVPLSYWVELVVYTDTTFKGGKEEWTQPVCLLALHDTHTDTLHP